MTNLEYTNAFFVILQKANGRKFPIIYDVEEVVKCVRMLALRWIQSERVVELELPHTTSQEFYFSNYFRALEKIRDKIIAPTARSIS